MVGLWRIEQRKPEQHNQQHSDRPEQVGEGACHVGNIRFDGMPGRGTSGGPISEQLSALRSQEIVKDRNVKVALFKDEFA
jgi:hypothetical protein